MAQFINGQDLRFRYLKNFLVEQAARVKEHAVKLAQEQNRPYEYLSEKIRKESRRDREAGWYRERFGLCSVGGRAVPYVFVPPLRAR